MIPLGDHPALVKHHDVVRGHYGGEPMGDHNDRPLGSARAQQILDHPLVVAVQIRGDLDRLGGAMDAGLPTSAEIAANLRGRHRSISPRAVDAHIKYVSDKLHLPKGTSRDVLVTLVIRSNLLS